jgi:carbamoyl-phosphate synthase small subunit
VSAGFLLLEDGSVYTGRLRTPAPEAVAEVVFTTNMTGYQEVFSDPSYSGQIVVMTAPQIGNYGVNLEDPESANSTPQVAGVVVRELSPTYSNWRATGSLIDWLESAEIPVLSDIDTRKLTRHLRSQGVMRGVIGAGASPSDGVRSAVLSCPSMEGLDLASVVSTKRPYVWGNPAASLHIVAYDYGIKKNILRLFEAHDARVTVIPATTPAEAVLEMKPDGVFLANGPGDPAAVEYAPKAIRTITESGMPTFGICLGHQLLGLTYGAETYKLPYGHHGGNHPVKEVDTGEVTITSQNHGFAVRGSEAGIPGAPALRVTHVNLNDHSIEGLRHLELPVFAVQYHPEAAPGPHDARPLFDVFIKACKRLDLE